MCDIFPEVTKCCFVFGLRVGMLFISVGTIVMGSLLLSIVELKSGASFDEVKGVTDIKDPTQAVKQAHSLMQSGIAAMSVLLIFSGFMLLFANLMNDATFIECFIILASVTVVLGFLMVIGTAYQCMFSESCILSDLDWLSASCVLLILIAFLFIWCYFLAVANSYVEGVAD